ncbi:hypothetical protein KVG96_14520 [Pseudomonas sp. COR58]|uniref:Uncharacterized protein n=1 Tax=Pseudomonas ekonensis TaxID=2842353 RepID=A0ABS6PFB4_9PSED|nr:hypothetical protein [Pseudomonas ekonensis]MBV4459171.1 hypothetical protein [Pseudomonas ekonensis]
MGVHLLPACAQGVLRAIGERGHGFRAAADLLHWGCLWLALATAKQACCLHTGRRRIQERFGLGGELAGLLAERTEQAWRGRCGSAGGGRCPHCAADKWLAKAIPCAPSPCPSAGRTCTACSSTARHGAPQ